MEPLHFMIYSLKSETIEFKVVFVIALVLSFCRNIALIEETKPWSIWRCLYILSLCVYQHSLISKEQMGGRPSRPGQLQLTHSLRLAGRRRARSRSLIGQNLIGEIPASYWSDLKLALADREGRETEWFSLPTKICWEKTFITLALVGKSCLDFSCMKLPRPASIPAEIEIGKVLFYSRLARWQMSFSLKLVRLSGGLVRRWVLTSKTATRLQPKFRTQAVSERQQEGTKDRSSFTPFLAPVLRPWSQ